MTNTLDAIYTVWLREMKRFLKSKSRFIGSLGQPFIWLALVGVGLSSAFALSNSSSYLDFMAVGIMGMTILFSSIFSGINVIWDRQFGFLKEILVAPVSRLSIVMGKVLGSATIAVIMAAIVLAVVVVFGIIPLAGLTATGIILAIIFMLLTSVTFVAVGLIIATSVNNIEAFQVLINFLVMPLFFLSGAIFPIVSSTPLWLRAISNVDPLFYAVDGIRGSLTGISAYGLGIDMLVVVVVAVAFVAVSDLMFRRIQGK